MIHAYSVMQTAAADREILIPSSWVCTEKRDSEHARRVGEGARRVIRVASARPVVDQTRSVRRCLASSSCINRVLSVIAGAHTTTGAREAYSD
jgi:hypothetical protein